MPQSIKFINWLVQFLEREGYHAERIKEIVLEVTSLK